MFQIINTEHPITYAIGDVHGEFRAICHWIKDKSLKDCNIVFLGDFGLGFMSDNQQTEELTRIENLCKQHNINIYILRGNHDDPSQYERNPYEGIFIHVEPLKDYSVVNTPQHTILCLGGAVSTDREYRMQEMEKMAEKLSIKKHIPTGEAMKRIRKIWWPNEGFIYDESILGEIISSGLVIDTVCSHTAPSIAFPLTRLDVSGTFDRNLLNDMKTERECMTKLYYYLSENGITPNNWYYGHFHSQFTEKIGNTTFHLLNMGRSSHTSKSPGGVFDMKEITAKS